MIGIFRKDKKIMAQSILEYTVLITLVAAAIILMNRYVIRGTMAGIKSWEEQVNDSLGEYYSFGQEGHWVLIGSSVKISRPVDPPVNPCFVGETYESCACILSLCLCNTYACQ